MRRSTPDRPLRVAPARLLLSLSLLAGLLGLLAALWLHETRPSAAQAPSDEPAFVTLLNVSTRTFAVDVDELGSNAGRRHTVTPEQPVTFPVDAGALPIDMIATCGNCRSVSFAVAAGQRVLVLLAATNQPALLRSDLHVVNEGGARRRGAIRTGAVAGAGRTLLPFDLRPGESASVGLRARGDLIDLSLTCAGCDPQRIRLGNGVDLEIPIR